MADQPLDYCVVCKHAEWVHRGTEGTHSKPEPTSCDRCGCKAYAKDKP